MDEESSRYWITYEGAYDLLLKYQRLQTGTFNISEFTNSLFKCYEFDDVAILRIPEVERNLHAGLLKVIMRPSMLKIVKETVRILTLRGQRYDIVKFLDYNVLIADENVEGEELRNKFVVDGILPSGTNCVRLALRGRDRSKIRASFIHPGLDADLDVVIKTFSNLQSMRIFPLCLMEAATGHYYPIRTLADYKGAMNAALFNGVVFELYTQPVAELYAYHCQTQAFERNMPSIWAVNSGFVNILTLHFHFEEAAIIRKMLMD